MSRRRIGNVLRKEWLLVLRSPGSLLYLMGIPLLLVGQALLLAWLLPRVVTSGVSGAADATAQLAGPIGFRVRLLDQFRFFVLLIPAMVANVFATLSIVEEKVTGTLEPLLATPVRTWELLSGKVLAGAIPAVLAAWISTGVFLAASWALGWGGLLPDVVDAAWVLAIVLLTPVVSTLSFLLGVIGSSRAGDVKSAQNLAVLIVLPLLAIIAVQVTGLVQFTATWTIVLAAGTILLDVAVLRIAVRLFDRESILVRWR